MVIFLDDASRNACHRGGIETGLQFIIFFFTAASVELRNCCAMLDVGPGAMCGYHTRVSHASTQTDNVAHGSLLSMLATDGTNVTVKTLEWDCNNNGRSAGSMNGVSTTMAADENRVGAIQSTLRHRKRFCRGGSTAELIKAFNRLTVAECIAAGIAEDGADA